tara:strand:+ start:157 stop:411 length:255 start_codon:yes stop_codon:yes gene_type:complete
MYYYNVFPLGVQTISQIEKGQEAIDDISKNVDNKRRSGLLSLYNKFFTLIPYISEKFKVIKTREDIVEKNELLEYMHNVSNEDI